MTLSDMFARTLDAVRFTPRDPYQEAIDWAKANPYFRIGEFVAAYHDPDQGIFVGYGEVIGLQWSNDYETWMCDVQIQRGATVNLPSYQLRDTRPDEQRMIWTAIRGGKA